MVLFVKFVKILYSFISGLVSMFIILYYRIFIHFTEKRKAGYQIMIWSIVAIHVARYGNVLICSYLNNFSRLRAPITCKFQIVMGLAGMRGSIAYILSLKCSEDFKGSNGGVIVFITIWIALFTVFFVSRYQTVIY